MLIAHVLRDRHCWCLIPMAVRARRRSGYISPAMQLFSRRLASCSCPLIVAFVPLLLAGMLFLSAPAISAYSINSWQIWITLMTYRILIMKSSTHASVDFISVQTRSPLHVSTPHSNAFGNRTIHAPVIWTYFVVSNLQGSDFLAMKSGRNAGNNTLKRAKNRSFDGLPNLKLLDLCIWQI